MSKKKLRITIDNQLIVAPIFNLDDIHWRGTNLGCPYCGIFTAINPKVDITQFGLDGSDVVHTVVKCGCCEKLYALRYINTYEVTE